jgi:hypothetical protein
MQSFGTRQGSSLTLDERPQDAAFPTLNVLYLRAVNARWSCLLSSFLRAEWTNLVIQRDMSDYSDTPIWRSALPEQPNDKNY